MNEGKRRVVERCSGTEDFGFPGGMPAGTDFLLAAEVAFLVDVGGALEATVVADALDGDAVGFRLGNRRAAVFDDFDGDRLHRQR